MLASTRLRRVRRARYSAQVEPGVPLEQRFRLVSLAGRGAAGAVYRAVDESTGAEVAIKRFAGVEGDERAEQRFAREIEILAQIESQHVVRYVAHGHDQAGVPFVAVEWVEGLDLLRLLRTRTISLSQAIEISRQAALGLAALHRVGVIHRDIKPSNLMVTETVDGPHVRLIDLGVAHVEGSAQLTRAGTMLGTPRFMSPEQVLGGDSVGPASDVFSLGVVLFELVTGRRAYPGEDVLAVAATVALEEPPRLLSVLPHAPPALDALLVRAMARRATDRIPDGAAFAAELATLDASELERALSGLPSGADDSETRSLQSPAIIGPERRVVTALFARVDGEHDARAFEQLSTSHGAEVHRLLAFAQVAVFGASASTGDEVLRAARSALGARALFPRAGLFLATGQALTGSLEISGQIIERGAVAAGAPGRPEGVAIDDATARLLSTRFEIASRDGQHQLVGELGGGTLRSSEPRVLVGREAEIEQALAAISRALRSASPCCLTVSGPAGRGKRTFARELLRRASLEVPELSVAAGTCSLFGSSPFGLLGSIVKDRARAFQLSTRSSGATSGAGARERGLVVPLLAELAAAPSSEVARAADAALLSDRVRDGFERWLLAALEAGPLVLLLEGMALADAPSLSVLSAVMKRVETSRLALVSLAETQVPSLLEDEVRLLLPPLSRSASSALVRALLGQAADDDKVRSIVELSEGEPFFLEELARATLEGGGNAALPATVLAVVQARLDALGPSNKRVLKAGAVIGHTFAQGALAAVLGGGGDLGGSVKELLAAGMLEQRWSPAGEELAFPNPLLREAAYEMVTEEDRLRAHDAAGEWLAHSDHASAFEVARHFELAGRAARSAEFFARAAEQALLGGDFKTSIECAERGLAGATATELSGRLHLTLAEARRWRGELEQALSHAQAATQSLHQGGALWFGAVREAIAAHGRLGHVVEIAPLARLALHVPALRGAENGQVAALVPAAVHLLYAGDASAANVLSARIEQLAGAIGALSPLARARLHQLRAALAQHAGDLELAVREQHAARAAFQQASDHRALSLVASNLGFLLLELGAFEAAGSVLSDAYETALRYGLSTIVPLAIQNLGMVAARTGQHERAILLQTEAAQRFEERKDPRLASASRVHLALSHLALGDLGRAEEQVERVVAAGYEPLLVGAHAVLSMVRFRERRLLEAKQIAQQAVSLLERLGAVEEFALQARVALAEACYALGEAQASMLALTEARAKLDATSARLRDPALRESYRRRIPEHARVIELTGGD